MRLLLKNAIIYDGAGFAAADAAITDGLLTQLRAGIAADCFDRVLDCRGGWLLPGLADAHVHLREPGAPSKETVATGTAAAARGGFTAVCAMPNLDPFPDCAAGLEAELEVIRRDAEISVLPFGCLTRSEAGLEPAALEELAGSVAGFSDDGRGVADTALMRVLMERTAALGLPVAAHCEDMTLRGDGCVNDCAYARRHGLPGITAESEYAPLRRDLELVRETGCRWHMCHVSTKESVALIRAAKREGLPVTCETAPHYLLLDDSCLADDGRFKMNPPIRSAADREALVAALGDGTIDIIATDHAPHTPAEKDLGLRGSLFGVSGLEAAFPVIYTGLVRTGMLSAKRLIDAMCVQPRRIFGLPGGRLAVGEPADLTVFGITDEYTLDPAEFLSMGRSTPFAASRVFGRCLLTFCGGRLAYESADI